MSKSVSLVAAAALAASIAAPTSAAVISPYSTTTTYVTLSGTLALSQTTNVSCNVVVQLAIAPGGGSALVTSASFAPGSWQCGWLVAPTGFPWTVTPIRSGRADVTGVSATSILGSCSGSLSLSVMNGVVDLTYVNMPGSPAICWMNGYLVTGQPLNVF